MPKRYKPSEHTPDTYNRKYAIFVNSWDYWLTATWEKLPSGQGGFFEIKNYQGDIYSYDFDEIDWWLDPMEEDDLTKEKV